MNIFVHDYPGHAFPIQLSRQFARMGHKVVHAFAGALESPRGGVTVRPDDPAGLTILPIVTGATMDKYALFRRVVEERGYGAALAKAVVEAAPDLFITCTTPNDVLDVLRKRLPPELPIIWWLQDIYSIGIRSILNRKLPFVGTVAGAIYRDKERRFGERANHIVSITADFVPFLEQLGVAREKISIIANWAPVNEIVPHPHENAWKQRQGLSGKKIVLYSGTLGLKHNPELLARAAAYFQTSDRNDVAVVVVSQGLGAEFLKRAAKERALLNLRILPWQPYEQLPEVLSSANVLTAIIEPDAGLFSVPSKILSYLCAGQPIVASIPHENLAAKTISNAGAGFVVKPGDDKGYIKAIERLLEDPVLAEGVGKRGRAYAERTFSITAMAEKFLALV